VLFSAEYLQGKFEAGLEYDAFVASGEPEGHHHQWHERFERLVLDDEQQRLVDSFDREMHIITITGTWCGDCALQGSALGRIAAAKPDKIHLRFLPRDPHADMMVKLRINAGYRVPVIFFCAEDFEPVSVFGDRSLSRYRSMAQKALGPSCPPIIADPPADPVREVLNEMLNEVERVHLVLRTSTRLREKHGD